MARCSIAGAKLVDRGSLFRNSDCHVDDSCRCCAMPITSYHRENIFFRRKSMKSIKTVSLGLARLVCASGAFAQGQQFIPILSYRVGPYAAGGSGYFGGAIDYFN